MGKRLYCGNLPYSATADEVRALFTESGTVTDVHIVMDRETGRSRGFAFVELATEEQAAQAIKEIDGRVHAGRPLTVKEAREREFRPGGYGGPRPGGGFRDRGGPGGGGFRDRGPGSGRPGGLGGGGYGARRGPSYPPPPPPPEFDPPMPMVQTDYAPPDDVDYRDRSDRGKRGRDRRGGRRKGDDFGNEGW
ncbi:MAG TPA: hypothetical protein VN033_07045 [Vulgatibacter sp.]|nr:hypothetical protein [Vulgatibacter sp.]